MDKHEMLARTFGGRRPTARPASARPQEAPARPAPESPARPEVLEIDLEPGEAAYLRRSSLLLADGPFALRTQRVASRRLPILGLFSGQNLWANRFEAQDGALRLVAGRDYHGEVRDLKIAPDRPVAIKPALYLGHSGDLSFTVQRMAKREFWTMTRVTGTGTVHLKVPGRTLVRPLADNEVVVDTNAVAAVTGPFTAHGRVLTTNQYLRAGEAENVRLSGLGEVWLQSERPPQASGGGGILGSLLEIFT
ncbi:AIM24 family protein [Parvularcula oceani]|uniref:AIM24 family protein n=1 Tax=Parvularcula oceani TaxID=1247963 RepID=UPI0004E2157D|nr:AIM24 family protein [Parvularcula oceani]